MRINDKNLKLLRQHVMVDSDISEEERQRSFDAIADVKTGLDDGRYVLSDRMSTIRDAAQKKQKSFRKKIKAKNRKMLHNATEDTRTIKSLDAFDEKFMYSTEEEIRRYADGMGITEVYQETKRFDEEWN